MKCEHKERLTWIIDNKYQCSKCFDIFEVEIKKKK